MKTTTKISKWGNSLAVRLPSAVLKQLQLQNNSAVTLESTDDYVIIKFSKPSDELSDLVNSITTENSHKIVEWGGPHGNEIW